MWYYFGKLVEKLVYAENINSVSVIIFDKIDKIVFVKVKEKIKLIHTNIRMKILVFVYINIYLIM